MPRLSGLILLLTIASCQKPALPSSPAVGNVARILVDEQWYQDGASQEFEGAPANYVTYDPGGSGFNAYVFFPGGALGYSEVHLNIRLWPPGSNGTIKTDTTYVFSDVNFGGFTGATCEASLQDHFGELHVAWGEPFEPTGEIRFSEIDLQNQTVSAQFHFTSPVTLGPTEQEDFTIELGVFERLEYSE